MLPRHNRLRLMADLQHVRKKGRRFSHPLAILLFCKTRFEVSDATEASSVAHYNVSRFAFVASRRVGNAVARNRAKRLLREVVRLHLDEVQPGWDCLIIAREATSEAAFVEVETAVYNLLSRARLITKHSETHMRSLT